MNYSEMSDFEIDLEVFQSEFGPIGSDKDMWRVWKQGKFRPCESWSDAGPIIAENGLTLIKLQSGIWVCVSEFIDVNSERSSASDKNPLRAAMIVFLMRAEGDV